MPYKKQKATRSNKKRCHLRPNDRIGFNQGMNVGSDGSMKESSMGLHDITWSTNTSEEEFKVVVREYDKNGKEISSITKTEKKRIGMEFIFYE